MSKWSSAFRDSRWQKKRLEIMERDDWSCRCCGLSGKTRTLNVHHAYYESGKAPWEYTDDTLVTMCEECHKSFHEYQKKLMVSLILVVGEAESVDSLFLQLRGYLASSFVGPAFENDAAYNKGYVSGRLVNSLSEDELAAIVMANHIGQIGGKNV